MPLERRVRGGRGEGFRVDAPVELVDEDGADTIEVESEGSDRQFHLGSVQKKIEIIDLERIYAEDDAYRSFGKNLGEYFTQFLPAIHVPLPNGRRLQVSQNDEVS